jgi:hypothetical protein
VISVTANGRFAITGQRNNSAILIWQLDTGEIITELEEHRNIVTSIAVTSDGRYFISASADGDLRLWQVQSSRQQSIRIFKGHSKRINQVIIDQQGKIAISASDDKSIRIWDILTGQCLHCFETIDSEYTTIALSWEGQYLFAGDAQGIIAIWCLDWLLKEKKYVEWDDNANVYIKNYLATHKTAEPIKELKTVLNIIKYAGFCGVDNTELGLQLVKFSQVRLNQVLAGNKLHRTKKVKKKRVNKKKIISWSGLVLMVFIVIMLLNSASDEVQLGSHKMNNQSNNEVIMIELTNKNEQLTMDRMVNIAVKLAHLNEQVAIQNGHLDLKSLKVPFTIEQLQEMLELEDNELVDAWGESFRYQGVKAGPFVRRIILRSSGLDRISQTDDDLLLNGYPHWHSLFLRQQDHTLLKLSSIQVSVTAEEKPQQIDELEQPYDESYNHSTELNYEQDNLLNNE